SRVPEDCGLRSAVRINWPASFLNQVVVSISPKPSPTRATVLTTPELVVLKEKKSCPSTRLINLFSFLEMFTEVSHVKFWVCTGVPPNKTSKPLLVISPTLVLNAEYPEPGSRGTLNIKSFELMS